MESAPDTGTDRGDGKPLVLARMTMYPSQVAKQWTIIAQACASTDCGSSLWVRVGRGGVGWGGVGSGCFRVGVSVYECGWVWVGVGG